MSNQKSILNYVLSAIIVTLVIILASQHKQIKEVNSIATTDTVVEFVYDTIFNEKIIHDTIIRTKIKTRTKISYVDTTPIVLNSRRSFVYIRDTFNIDERTYYITEEGDTVKAFYFDYTYYIFRYHFKDSLVAIDSVLGCDLYTHCICDDRERVVIFHTCEGESRMIINMLNKNKEEGIEP